MSIILVLPWYEKCYWYDFHFISGAVAAVKLATLPHFPKSPVGQYIWHDMTVVDWVNGPMPKY